MNDKVTDFPQFRMLSNGKSFYKIIDARKFEEIQLFGSKKIRHEVIATQYPEILKIQDMLNCHDNHYVITNVERWMEIEMK